MLNFLKAATAASSPASDEKTAQNLDPDTLRFTLEYQNAPDLDTERTRLENLLEGDGFDLFYLSEKDDRQLLVLQFNNVRRQQSAEYLFQVAQDLTDMLEIVSVTPDLDPPWSDVETDTTEGVGELMSAFCLSDADSPGDPDWAIKLIKADTVAARGVNGAGVMVGQPDTGIAIHKEIEEGTDRGAGYNFIENTDDPTDPVLQSMSSPGHGTATSSVVISRNSHIITGSAPGAILVPIRVTNSVVLTGGSAVARGIDHARRTGCDVITMSMGGLFSISISRAVKRAVENGVIVLAAAGNCVGVVVYPASSRNVIAVAAVDEQLQRWKGSCHGRAVDISAPGENVHVARRSPGSNSTEKVDDRGQGTSYAVALTAGCAALWLQAHGRNNIAQHAQTHSVSVQELFRSAVRQTAQKPSSWDSSDMGAGVVDADALVSLQLDEIQLAPASESAEPGMRFFSGELLDCFRAEADYIAFHAEVANSGDATNSLEAAGVPQPSRQFLKAVPAVRDLTDGSPVRAPETARLTLPGLVRALPAGTPPPLPSPTASAHEHVKTLITTEGANTVLDRVQKSMNQRSRRLKKGPDPELQKQAIMKMEEMLVSLSKDTDEQIVQDRFVAPGVLAGLEALVELTGRPALRVDTLENMISENAAEDWGDTIYGAEGEWRKFTDAVGRIDIHREGEWRHRGTGFLISEDLVLTNRHVLDALAEPMPTSSGTPAFAFKDQASISFTNTAVGDKMRFEIVEVVTAGAHRIGRYVNLEFLDMAVVRINSASLSAESLPTPVNMAARSTRSGNFNRVMVAGYPARSKSGPSDPDETVQFWSRIREIYGDAYGEKYISPGLIKKSPGMLPRDTKKWSFSHDATTLGGNSGSIVFSIEDQFSVCGIHFGGKTRSQNLAHDLLAVVDGGDGVFDTEILKLTNA